MRPARMITNYRLSQKQITSWDVHLHTGGCRRFSETVDDEQETALQSGCRRASWPLAAWSSAESAVRRGRETWASSRHPARRRRRSTVGRAPCRGVTSSWSRDDDDVIGRQVRVHRRTAAVDWRNTKLIWAAAVQRTGREATGSW